MFYPSVFGFVFHLSYFSRLKCIFLQYIWLPLGLFYRDFEVSETLHYLRADVFFFTAFYICANCNSVKVGDHTISLTVFLELNDCLDSSVVLMFLHRQNFKISTMFHFTCQRWCLLYIPWNIPVLSVLRLNLQHLISVLEKIFPLFSYTRMMVVGLLDTSDRRVCFRFQRALKMFNS